MAMEITVKVSQDLGQRLEPFKERLQEVLERGLHEMMAEQGGAFQDENQIVALLASRPEPDQVLAISPSPELQTRVSTLLMRNKQGMLTRQEETELERYLTLEHLVRLAKAHAYRLKQKNRFENNS